jgi:hypothetical protein
VIVRRVQDLKFVEGGMTHDLDVSQLFGGDLDVVKVKYCSNSASTIDKVEIKVLLFVQKYLDPMWMVMIAHNCKVLARNNSRCKASQVISDDTHV